MCGIVGYIGSDAPVDVLVSGLARLEYRGYDSAGIAVLNADGQMQVRKRSGKLAKLKEALAEHPIEAHGVGIGHTRWATHGGPSDVNAHPHLSEDGKLAVIHNGIIENFHELKAELGEVHTQSETDTEIVAIMLGRAVAKTGSLETAFREVVRKLEGTFTLLAIHSDEPEKIVSARHHSPLVVGFGEGENFLGSDVAAFVEHTRRAVAVGEDNIAVVSASEVRITDFAGNPVECEEFEVAWDASAANKGGWSSFMAKEISEQPEAVRNTLRGRIEKDHVLLNELEQLGTESLQKLNRVVIIGCGTAAYAGLVGEYCFEEWAQIPTKVELSHEFRYRRQLLDEHTLVISVSQSGETMDTLMAVKHAKELGAKTLSICNTQSATIPRESDAVVYTHAGPEIAVASTKAFVSQVVALQLIALYLGRVGGVLDPSVERGALLQLEELPEKVAEAVKVHDRVCELAHWMANTSSVLFLGRGVGYPTALEGALKLKEIAYIHAEGFAAGELKHGPIALIDHGQPVFVLVPSPRRSPVLHAKVVSNIQEIRARGARVIAVVETGDTSVLPYADEVIRLPLADPMFEPILQIIPLQWFALELSTVKGLDVDQPRNLAKSVTVE